MWEKNFLYNWRNFWRLMENFLNTRSIFDMCQNYVSFVASCSLTVWCLICLTDLSVLLLYYLTVLLKSLQCNFDTLKIKGLMWRVLRRALDCDSVSRRYSLNTQVLLSINQLVSASSCPPCQGWQSQWEQILYLIR